MGKTVLTIAGEKFHMNGMPVYGDIAGCDPKMHGMLMNARFIQGIFDTANPQLFHRYGKRFDPAENTRGLIAALPAWYAKGLRCITVGMQGGGSCFTVKGQDLQNNPYSPDGNTIDPAYLQRLDALIDACDRLGMAVIVSFFYNANSTALQGAQAVLQSIKTLCTYLRNQNYTNLILEIANEHDLFSGLPIIAQPQSVVALIELARQYSGGMPIGCSESGGRLNEEICRASDVILLHGNGCSRSALYNLVLRARAAAPGRPVVINEDSQAIGQLAVCKELRVSWGYYNNMTKQEPPVNWAITPGEDSFFAWRMADMLGIPQIPQPPLPQAYCLQGFEEPMHCGGLRFPRVASLYPESINFVRFYQNGQPVYTCYNESFSCGFRSNWSQSGVPTKDGDRWRAEVILRSGETVILEKTVLNR